MKPANFFRALFVLLWLAVLPTKFGHADDTEIFTVNPNVDSSRPNILIIMDNSSNWGATIPNLKTALSSLFSGATALDDKFNVGLMMHPEAGSGAQNGGYVRFAVRQLTTDVKTAINGVIGSLSKASGGDQAADALAVPSLAFYEARNYFVGATAYSGGGSGAGNQAKRDYRNNAQMGANGTTLANGGLTTGNAFTGSASNTYVSPITNNCQKNFIIYINNGKAAETGGIVTASNNFLSGLGGDTTVISLTPNGEQSVPLDEWARYLSTHDIDQNSANGTQTITTYVIEVRDSGAPAGQYTADYTKLLESTAKQGKGKFFQVSNDASQISVALNKIFQEIQSVNSVFASSTLPVSVNVRGTYLNQIYMGVFRPDGNSSPRWPGNLKQYKLGVVSNELKLFDNSPTSQPVESATTGFIIPSGVSFWTHTVAGKPADSVLTSQFWDSSYYPEAQDTSQSTGLTEDSPDGALVEKGGVAQRIRDVYGTSTSGRTIYTCTGTCGASTTTLDLFNTSNSNITAGVLGISSPQTVSSLTRNTTAANDYTVTANLSSHGYSTGDLVTISGANQGAYNGTYPITVTDADNFTYGITVSPTTPATGTLSYTVPGATATITQITYDSVTGLATATAAGHLFADGDVVSLSGSSVSTYNNTFTIQNVVALTSFKFPVTQKPTSPGGGGTISFTGQSTIKNIESSTANPTPGLVRSGTTVTVKVTSNFPNTSAFNSGQVRAAVISNATPSDYDQGGASINCTITSNRTCTFTIAVSPPSTLTESVTAAKAAGVSAGITSITRSGTTATVTTTAVHTLAGGNSVSISGANQSQYNGTFTVLNAPAPTANTFAYTVTTSPVTPATGTIRAQTGGLGANKDDVINWVRGQNARIDDNPSGDSSHVRGYHHGDVLHSRPAVVNYARTGQPADRDIVVYYGSNDGIFRAVKGGQDGSDGYEKWGFIPSEVMSKLTRLYSNDPIISTSSPKPYFMDGPVGVYVKDVAGDGRIESSSGDAAYIYIGARRGGRFIYGLDVSDPSAAPSLAWKKTNSSTGFAQLGYTFSEPRVARISARTNPVLIFAAGYDTGYDDLSVSARDATSATMGKAIYIVDAASGALVWSTGPETASAYCDGATTATSEYHKNTSGMTYPLVGDVTLVDSDQNNVIDRLYATDTGGNVWRIDINDTDRCNWTVTKLASIGGTGVNQRKFLYGVDVVQIDSTWDAVLVGSGDREHPLETTVVNRFYMFKDNHSTAPNGTTITESDTTSGQNALTTVGVLCDLTSNALQGNDATAKAAAQNCMNASGNRGWRMTFPSTGEKGVSGATTIGGTTIFATNVPQSQVSSTSCTNGLGEARIYAINYLDATIPINPATGLPMSSSRYAVRTGGGFPPSPVPVRVEIGGNEYIGAITGTQVVTATAPTIGQRFRTYWYFESDNK